MQTCSLCRKHGRKEVCALPSCIIYWRTTQYDLEHGKYALLLILTFKYVVCSTRQTVSSKLKGVGKNREYLEFLSIFFNTNYYVISMDQQKSLDNIF